MADELKYWGWHSVWPAPAKLNLFLHVLGRRPDGYHRLQTVFRFLDHGDVLYFSPRDDSEIVLTTPLPGVPAAADLTVRAANALRQACACRQGVNIALDKRLPMGGGLGGGSSDAATVLIGLNHLWGTGLTRKELLQLALPLGADVPVFVNGVNAFAEGVGEQLTALSLPAAWYLVVEPSVAVDTASIFAAPELVRDTPPLAATEWRPGMGGNDLEAVACARFPEIAEAMALLAPFGRVRMSGSGSCVFVECEGRDAAVAAITGLPPGVVAWIAQGLDVHPLHALLDD